MALCLFPVVLFIGGVPTYFTCCYIFMSQWRPGIFLFLIICNFRFLVGTMLSKLWEPIQQTRGDRRIRGGVRQQLAALEADEAIEGDPTP